MGMRVSGVSSGTSAAMWQARQQDFKSLTSAITGGDLAAAQKAFASLGGSSSTQSNSNNPLAAIGQALQSGNISAAQTALANLQANRSGGGHRHHQAPTSPASTTVPLDPTSGTLVNTYA